MTHIRNRSTVLIGILLLTTALSACGLRLRGDYLLPPELQTLNVSSLDKYGEITRIFKQQLKQNDVAILSSFDPEKPEIRIMRDKLDRRTLSVFPTGQVAEYELIYTVQFELRRNDMESRSFSFEVNRDYQDDPSVALAKSRELNLILKELRQTAVDRMIRELASVQL